MKSSRLLIAAAVALVIGVVGGTMYYRYTHSPEYALKQIQNAIRAKDVQKFERYVDVERVSTGVVDQIVVQVSAQAMRDAEGQEGLAAMGAMMGVGMLDKMKPALVQTMRTSLTSAVKAGSMDSAFAAPREEGAPSVAAMGGGFGGAGAFEGLDGVRRNGNTAVANFRVRPPLLDTTLVLGAKMEKVDGTWRMVGPDNLSAFLQTISDLQTRRLTAVNDSLRTRIAATVEFGPIQRQMFEQEGETYLQLDVPVRNRGAAPLDLVSISFPAGSDALNAATQAPVAAGADAFASGTVAYNPFIQEHATLREGDISVENAVAVGVVVGGAKPDTLQMYPDWATYQQHQAARAARKP